MHVSHVAEDLEASWTNHTCGVDDDRWRLLIIYRSIEWVTCRFFLQFSVCVMDVCVGYIYITCVCVMFHPRSLLFKKNDDDDDDDDNDESILNQ